MYLHTGNNVHHQHSIRKSVYIRAVNEMHLHIHRRDTEVKWSTQQFIQMIFITIDTRNTSIILNAYHHIATIGIGKGNEYDSQCFGIYPKALAVEKLSFWLLLQILYINHSCLLLDFFSYCRWAMFLE